MIKKIIFFIVFTSAFIMVDVVTAQKAYLPILEEGKDWRYINYSIYGEDGLHEPAKPWGWKAMDKYEEAGHQVFLLQYQDLESESSNQEEVSSRMQYEEDGVLWSFSYEEWEYMPMVDFNLEVGDMVDDWYEVIWKESVIIEGVERCVMALQRPGATQVNYWIEGIGAIDDVYISPTISHIGERTRMTACWIGDTCLFDSTHMDDYVSGVKPLTSHTEADNSCYDILGRRIAEPVPGQLYIQGGRKHLRKAEK